MACGAERRGRRRLIIHENRFTYEAKGLKKIIIPGSPWELETGRRSPLGGIVVRRRLPMTWQP